VAGERATTTGRLAQMTAERFHRPMPWIVAPAVYRALCPLLRRVVRGRQRLALEHTQVFIPYLNIGVRFQDHVTRARLEPAGVRLLPFEDYFARLLDFALAADWGKRPLPHPCGAADMRSDQHPEPSPPPPRLDRSMRPIFSVKSASRRPRPRTESRSVTGAADRPCGVMLTRRPPDVEDLAEPPSPLVNLTLLVQRNLKAIWTGLAASTTRIAAGSRVRRAWAYFGEPSSKAVYGRGVGCSFDGGSPTPI
jgi:hypothetical protein